MLPLPELRHFIFAQPIQRPKLGLNGVMSVFNLSISWQCFPTSYGTLVRPHLEYGLAACAQTLVADVSRLERIQRLSVRLVTGIHYLTYEERLLPLGSC